MGLFSAASHVCVDDGHCEPDMAASAHKHLLICCPDGGQRTLCQTSIGRDGHPSHAACTGTRPTDHPCWEAASSGMHDSGASEVTILVAPIRRREQAEGRAAIRSGHILHGFGPRD